MRPGFEALAVFGTRSLAMRTAEISYEGEAGSGAAFLPLMVVLKMAGETGCQRQHLTSIWGNVGRVLDGTGWAGDRLGAAPRGSDPSPS